MSELRFAVVGAGHMGSHHAAKIRARSASGLRLIGVADPALERASVAAGDSGAVVTPDFAELLPEVDAVVVAVPTVSHYGIVSRCLEADCHVLVEKPIAAELDQAETMIRTAKDKGRVLHVGHLEWHNSALRGIAPAIRRPRFIEAHRMGPFVGRATDVDIIRDLMIHDLDIVQRLLGEEPNAVEGIGIPVVSDAIDIANARLHFPGGCIANFTASRVSPNPMRKIRLFQADGYFSIDFLERSATILRRRRDAQGAVKIETEPLAFDADDSLEGQLGAFVDAIHDPKASRDRSCDAALRALRTALRVIEALPPLDEFQ